MVNRWPAVTGFICSCNVDGLPKVGDLMPPERWETRFRDELVKRYASGSRKESGRALLLFEERLFPARQDLVGALTHHVQNAGIEILQLGRASDLTHEAALRAQSQLLNCIEAVALELANHRRQPPGVLLWRIRDQALLDPAQRLWGFRVKKGKGRFGFRGAALLDRPLPGF
ncbi:hypothetical protein [Candidatus Nephthysia bennettiae]|uniref:Uncharacterized protein n=1 Tax=Candidatus Nephthysia bennettiae TaxID=3127016 RepID=A0A934ND59_9BACT|nr:hypothetical protein [Candidatus Dormibacteraeota bacterium]MBJ7611337.1 hypothetical protein [Candidatus Dormibacteraeota bacterium]